jgi:hypothetical protein
MPPANQERLAEVARLLSHKVCYKPEKTCRLKVSAQQKLLSTEIAFQIICLAERL